MNSVWFVLEDQTLPPSYHTTYLGKDLNEYTQRDEETPSGYIHPIQSGDRLTIQYEEDAFAGTPVLELFDSAGNLYHTFTAPSTQTIAGNYVPGTTTQVISFQWSIRLNMDISSFAEGFYKFRITPADTTQPKLQSEWVDVQDDHEGTLLFKYNHSISEHDTLFDSTFAPRFSLRVHGQVSRPKPDGENTAFDDQEKELTQLSSRPFRTHELIISGPGEGIPDWMQDKVNWLFACDTVSIDGKIFTKEPDAKWEFKELENYPHRGMAVTIREREVMEPYRHRNGFLPFFTLPAYPFFIKDLSMSDGVNTVVVCINQNIEDAAALTALLTEVNTVTTVPIYDLDGAFSNASGVLGYTNAAGENYHLVTVNYLTKRLELTIDVANAAQPYTFGYANGVVGIVWEAGIAVSYTGTASIVNRSWTFGSTGTKTVYIWHDDNVTAFVSTLNNSNKLENITGVFPAACTGINISNQNIVSLDPDIIKPCEPVLAALTITFSNFEGFTAAFFAWGTFFTYPNLLWIALGGNVLDSAYVDAWFVDMISKDYTVPGTVLIQSQTPAAPPTGTSSTQRAFLTGLGWSLTTD